MILLLELLEIIIGLTLTIWLYYNFFFQTTPNDIENILFWQELSPANIEYVKYFFIGLWFIPLIVWITNICVMKKKYVRISQIIMAIILLYISSVIKEWPELDIDALIWFLWLILLIWWITWKIITSNCMKYAEKITKIRI